MRLFAFLLVACVQCFAGSPGVTSVEPPFWWVGMKNTTLQLMLYGENLQSAGITCSSPDLIVERVHHPANGSYAFVDIRIGSHAKPGSYTFTVTTPESSFSFRYSLRERIRSEQQHQGFDPSDVIYLIVTDRFVNGDPSNDTVEGMADGLDRSNAYGRHGGDLHGVITKLDYLRDLGVTALWLLPLVENNTPGSSYHGYAVTDLYKIDRRFGSNALYESLVREAHARGLKVIMDHVNNHISIHHRWIKNLPTDDWLNGTPENHAQPFHSKEEMHDIHSDSLMQTRGTIGWFIHQMPDLNQRNPFVANYLIQSTIWWIESTGIDGIREDTYPYIEPAFRERWCAAILDEYPRFNIVGEVWIQDPAHLAPYQRGSFIPQKHLPQLPAVTDFGLFDAFMKAFSNDGFLDAVFYCLTKDFLFPDPSNLVTFLDNHDIRRIAYHVEGDSERLKLALTLLLTTRGIPQILYGTEIGMMGGRDHGRLRADFPGGFPGDERNAFTEAGRTAQENDLFFFTKRLLHLRRSYGALRTGSLVHFKPANNVYVYFRKTATQTLMVVLNRSNTAQTVDLFPYAHHLPDVNYLRELIRGTEHDLSSSFKITQPALSGGIYEIVTERE